MNRLSVDTIYVQDEFNAEWIREVGSCRHCGVILGEVYYPDRHGCYTVYVVVESDGEGNEWEEVTCEDCAGKVEDILEAFYQKERGRKA